MQETQNYEEEFTALYDKHIRPHLQNGEPERAVLPELTGGLAEWFDAADREAEQAALKVLKRMAKKGKKTNDTTKPSITAETSGGGPLEVTNNGEAGPSSVKQHSEPTDKKRKI